MINNLFIPSVKQYDAQVKKERNRKCCQYSYPVQVCYNVGNKAPVPLRKVEYNLKVLKGFACVEIEQTYSTTNIDQPIDLEYLFVINKNAAVTKMIVQLGDNKVIGIIKEKEEAKQQYEEGIKQGKTMTYCEQDDQFPEIKRIKLGQLAPQKELKVVFEYIQPFEICFNQFYKVEISPLIDENYVRQKNENQYNRDLFNYLDKSVQLQQFRYDFTQDFKVSINTGSKITFIKSPTHSLSYLQAKDQSELFFELDDSPNNFLPIKHFVFLFATEDINVPSAILSHTANDALQEQKYCATLTFVPKFNELPIDDAYQQYLDNLNFGQNNKINRGNYLFIIDRSGSMSGSLIEKAKAALTLFLKSLPDDSLFNIVSFGSRNSSLWNKPKLYNQQSLDDALKHVSLIKADMGGTEILQTLESVVYNSNYSGKKNQTLNVFLLTDGEDTPEPIINLVKSNNKPETRVYTIGIGSGCCQYLIKRIAEVGNGKCQFVSDTEDLNEKVIDLLDDSITSYLQQFNLESNVQNIYQIIPNPQSIVSLKKNQLFTLQILFSDNQSEENLNFQISFFDPQDQKQVQYQVALNLKNSKQNEYFHKLAIHKQIQFYENAQRNGDSQLDQIKTVKQQIEDSDIINLSVEHQILCSKTAYVCELCDVEDQFKQQKREKIIINEVKNLEKKTYGKSKQNVLHRKLPQKLFKIDLNYGVQECRIDFKEELCCKIDYRDFSSQRQQCLMDYDIRLEEEELQQQQLQSNPPRIKKLTLDEVIQFAQADGSFKICNEFHLDQIQNDMKLSPNLWNTIFALLYLEIQCPQSKNIWQLVYQKGILFLIKNGVTYKDMKNRYFDQYKAILEKME